MALYQFRAYQNYDARPSDDWVTSIEYDVDGSIDSGAVTDTANSFVVGLQEMLLENVIIDRVTVSTWVPDGTPYDPSTMRVIPYGVFGLVEFLLGGPTDDDLTLFIRKAVNTGRAGKFFLRGAIDNSDLTAASGAWQIASGFLANYVGRVVDFFGQCQSIQEPALIGAAFLGWNYPATPEGEKQIPTKNYAETPTVRTVFDFALVGPTERQDTQ